MRRPIAQTTVREALDSALVALTAVGVESPRLDAELLLAAAMGVDRAVLIADPGRALEPGAARIFQGFAARRREREPVAYILGRKGFRTIELAVDQRVLIPRPETEHVVEAVLDLPRGARVCDIGTGSGAIALALKAERPDLEIVATDVSADALRVAGANARRLGLDVSFLEGDLMAPVRGPFDAIVSNPPYVADGDTLAAEIVRHEPAIALFAGPDGLAVYRRLAPAAAASGARVVAVEVGAGQAAPVAELLRAVGFDRIETIRDLAGIERVVVARVDENAGADPSGSADVGGAAPAGAS